MDPESRGDQRDGCLNVGHSVVDARCEARSAAEHEHFVVPRDNIFRRSNEKMSDAAQEGLVQEALLSK